MLLHSTLEPKRQAIALISLYFSLSPSLAKVAIYLSYLYRSLLASYPITPANLESTSSPLARSYNRCDCEASRRHRSCYY